MLVLRLCTLNLDTFYLSSVICHRSGRRRAPAASSSRWMRPSARRCGWHQVRHHPERTSWTSRRPPYMSTYIILGVSTAELSLWSSAWTTPSRESWCQHRWISTMAASTSNKHTLASKHTYLHLGIRPSKRWLACRDNLRCHAHRSRIHYPRPGNHNLTHDYVPHRHKTSPIPCPRARNPIHTQTHQVPIGQLDNMRYYTLNNGK